MSRNIQKRPSLDLSNLVETERLRWLREVQGRVTAFQKKHAVKYPPETHTMVQYTTRKGFYAILPRGMVAPKAHIVKASEWPWFEAIYPFIKESD